MKKISFLLVYLSFSAISLFGQTSRNALSLSIGPSFPVGNYSSTSLNNGLSGNAKTGTSVNLSFTHKLENNVGLEAMLYGQANALNTKELADQFSKAGFFSSEAGIFSQSGNARYYSNWSVDKKSWRIGSLLLGFSKEWHIASADNKISITPKALVGFAYVESPAIQAQSKMDTAYVVFKKDNAKGVGPSILFSSLFKYQLTSRWEIFVNVEYFSTKISFKKVTSEVTATNGGLVRPGIFDIENSNSRPISSKDLSDYKQSINTLNTKLGVSFNF